MSNQPSSKEKKDALTIVKFGGGVIKPYGEGIPKIVERVRAIKQKDDDGPVVVVSAPKGITDLAIDIGEDCAKTGFVSNKSLKLRHPYERIRDSYMREPLKDTFNDELNDCFKEVDEALEHVVRNKEFEGGNRAIVLAYSGELLMARAMDFVLRSNEIDSVGIPFEKWPIITDRSFEGATFLLDESRRESQHLIECIKDGKVPIVGGFVGKTIYGRETTYERGGSDRTAVDLGILLSHTYDVTVDFEKDSMVMSANPKVEGIDKKELDPVWNLSYNEAILGAQYGMDIVDSVAFIDIQHANLEIPLTVTDINDPKRVTKIQREASHEDNNPIKIVTGRKDCIIMKMRERNKLSLRDYLEKNRRFENFTELRPYKKDDEWVSKLLFLDGTFFRKNGEEIRRYDEFSEVEYDLGAITLIGDEMYRVPDVSAEVQSAIKGYDINIENADAQKETSSILIIVKEEHVERCVSLIHKRRAELNVRANRDRF
ncbi:MAG: aspartate kinase [Nitrososphaerales archaeon]|nr:aspartate kinase [Nitrososphaerales archaeon]